MDTFPLAPETIRMMLLRSRLRAQLIVTITFLVFAVSVTSSGQPVNGWVVGGVIAVLFLADFATIFFSYRSQLRALYSVRIEINSRQVVFRQFNHEPVVINRADVEDLTETRDGLLITTPYARLKMLIPRGLAKNGDFEVRRILSEWAPIDRRQIAGRRTSWLMFWFSVLAGLFILMFANSLLIAVPLGVFLFFFGTYAERRLNSTYDVDPRIIRSYSIAFSFLIVVVMMKSCLMVWFPFR